jgi:hypothetical protein
VTDRIVHLSISIEADLVALLKSAAIDNQLNVSELVRESVRFALNSRSFLKRMKVILDSADPMIMRCIGHTSISVRTLMRRLVRRADVVADNHSSALTMIRLNHSGLTGHGAPFRRLRGTMGQEETRMKHNRTEPVRLSDARHTPEIRSDLEELPW